MVLCFVGFAAGIISDLPSDNTYPAGHHVVEDIFSTVLPGLLKHHKIFIVGPVTFTSMKSMGVSTFLHLLDFFRGLCFLFHQR